MNLVTEVRKTALRTAWSVGFLGLHRGATLTSQAATYRPRFPVQKYSSIEEITANTSKLKWTEDPWNGKLDLMKHPTFMQEAIQEHPDYSGDCEDWSAYWITALLKNKLCDKVIMGVGMWQPKGKNTLDGHAVTVFRVPNGDWYWVSNWFHSVPQKIDNRFGWCDPIIKDHKRVVIGWYDIDGVANVGGAEDTLLIGSAHPYK